MELSQSSTMVARTLIWSITEKPDLRYIIWQTSRATFLCLLATEVETHSQTTEMWVCCSTASSFMTETSSRFSSSKIMLMPISSWAWMQKISSITRFLLSSNVNENHWSTSIREAWVPLISTTVCWRFPVGASHKNHCKVSLSKAKYLPMYAMKINTCYRKTKKKEKMR